MIGKNKELKQLVLFQNFFLIWQESPNKNNKKYVNKQNNIYVILRLP